MRLIDADLLMDDLENDKPENWTNSPGEIQEQADWERFYGMVSVANTIDAIPVVRCKDCKKFKKYQNVWGVEGFKCDLLCADAAPDNFCCWGERKDK